MNKRIYIVLLAMMLLFIKMDVNAVKYDFGNNFIRNVPYTLPDGSTVNTYKYWTGVGWSQPGYNSRYCPNPIELTYRVTYNYKEAYKMLDLVNAERRKAGVAELKSNDALMEAAMKRAAEVSMYFEHERPDGSDYTSANMFTRGENIARGNTSAEYVNSLFVKSERHYHNMINERWTYGGFGCVGGTWVQIYTREPKYGFYEVGGSHSEYDDSGRYVFIGDPSKKIDLDRIPFGELENYEDEFTVHIKPDFITSIHVLTRNYGLEMEEDEKDLIDTPWDNYYDALSSLHTVGERIEYKLQVRAPLPQNDDSYHYMSHYITDPSQYRIISSNPDICRIDGDELVFNKSGKVTITAYLTAAPDFKTSVDITVNDPELNKEAVAADGNTYKITDVKGKTVTFMNPDWRIFATPAKNRKATIPATAKISGKTYKVTEIADGAFEYKRSITAITIGSNVTKIGKNAFKGCSRLKKITVKTKKLQSIGSNALKGTNKKLVIKAPKSKLSAYKKLFKNKGNKNVKVKK